MCETLEALKDSKRFVEIKFQKSLEEKLQLNKEIDSLIHNNEILQVKSFSLQESVDALTKENYEQTSILADIQQSFVEKSSHYETQIHDMQIELERRVDEMRQSRVEDHERVRGEFANLFDEKASELMQANELLHASKIALLDAQSKISDFQDREKEFNFLLNKLRENSNNNENAAFSKPITLKLGQYQKDSELLESKILELKQDFLANKANNSKHIQRLSKQLSHMKAELENKDIVIESLRDKSKVSNLWNLKLQLLFMHLQNEEETVLGSHNSITLFFLCLTMQVTKAKSFNKKQINN